MALPIALGVLASPLIALPAALRAAVQALARRRVLGQLGQMDDRMLRDIGLTRQDVWSAAAEPLFRDPTIELAARAFESRMASRAAARERRHMAALLGLRANDGQAA